MRGLINSRNTSRKLDDYTHQLMVEKLTEMEVDAKVGLYRLTTSWHIIKANLSEYVEDEKARATCITLDDEDLAQRDA